MTSFPLALTIPFVVITTQCPRACASQRSPTISRIGDRHDAQDAPFLMATPALLSGDTVRPSNMLDGHLDHLPLSGDRPDPQELLTSPHGRCLVNHHTLRSQMLDVMRCLSRERSRSNSG